LAAAAMPRGERGRLFAAEQGGLEGLIVHTRSPNNAEPPLEALVRSWITPTPLFYIRSHAPNPQIKAGDYRLQVEGMVEQPGEYSLAELKDRFPGRSAVATLTCAGNRRDELSARKPIEGVQWRAGAIGNAEWSGVTLADVLKHAGVKPEAGHVWFESVDLHPKGGKQIPFGGSIPLEKVFEDAAGMPGALLAHGMNGEPLTADHGYPLRVVVPGYIGARSVKWLRRIVVSDRPSPNHYLTHAYKLVEKDAELAWEEAGPLYRFEMNCVIAAHRLTPGGGKAELVVDGFALPPGSGATLAAVEVSADGGETWTKATFTKPSRPFQWSLWQASLKWNGQGDTLIARATDSNGETMPEHEPWNMKGYMMNAWHRTPIRNDQ
jgi:sulfite oxidase